MSLAEFEIVRTSAGAISIRNTVVNEIMHNPIGPWLEANALYVDQSRLRDHLQNGSGRPLVLYDVGLGAASNAVASISAALGLPANARPLHIVSFENNLALLEFTLLHAYEFDHLTGMEEALAQLLTNHHWESPCGRVSWVLRVGSFLDTLASETTKPDLIFYDPYSPKVNGEMWTLSCFEMLRKHCDGPDPVTLFTYSVSTPIRAAMLLAGFYVGYGLPTGLKEETTQASTCLKTLDNPLCKPWFGRWQRSHKKLPYDAEHHNQDELYQRLTSHEQFI